ncbi:MAG: hypothetical protein KGL38_14515, partial [Gemmatimonadota bacterium]|nr:hypothetical protein [Gemmatimonadota bacterium]
MTGDIFIQIAAYRDPQLGPTLRDAMGQANDPSRLHFCIAWQHDDDECRDALLATLPAASKVTVLDIPYRESRGACWARHQIQQHYQGEAYTLQLDSHHRFVRGWDDVCIGMLEQLRATGVEKPLLTAYLPSFDPDNDPAGRVDVPWHLAFDRFIPEGAVFFRPAAIADWQDRAQPMRSRFYSAHFAFTVGAFAREVQHNPEYYFHGEEISISVRAYTHGYDLFHPHRLVAWHEYTRKGRAKHWDDHANWWSVNAESHGHNRLLFGMDEYAGQPALVAEAQRGPYGFGSARSLEEYERFAGLCFRRRAVTPAVLDAVEPVPGDNAGGSYAGFAASCVPRFRPCIDVSRDRVALEDYDFWSVAFMDEGGNELFRQNADEAEIGRMKQDPDACCKIWRDFDTDVRPKT